MSRPAFGRAEVLVSSPTKRKKTRTAARLKPRFKNHGYSHCPAPSNVKYKESKWLWASQLGKCIVSKQWQFWCHRIWGFNPKVKLKLIKAHWHCLEIVQIATVRECTRRCSTVENSYWSVKPSYLRPRDRGSYKESAACPITKASNCSHFHIPLFFVLYFPSHEVWEIFFSFWYVFFSSERPRQL